MRATMTFICETTMREEALELYETHVRGRLTRDWSVYARTCPALAARGVIAAGVSELGERYEVVRIAPGFPHVGVCCAGRVDYLVDGRWQPVTPGTVLLAPRDVPHGSRSKGRAAAGRVAWVLFEPGMAPSSRPWDQGSSRLLLERDQRPLWWALQGLYVEVAGIRDPAAVGHWADLVVSSAGTLADERQEPHGSKLRELWEHVDGALHEPWTASSLARRAHQSTTHFRRLCQTLFGRPPIRHLTILRMQRAALLLRTTDHKLSTIAAEVGYGDVFAFSVAFKRWCGASPRAYRRPGTQTGT